MVYHNSLPRKARTEHTHIYSTVDSYTGFERGERELGRQGMVLFIQQTTIQLTARVE